MDRAQIFKPLHDLKKEIDNLKKNKSLHGFVEKFRAEKKSLEKKIEKTVQSEIKKAKKFLDDQKRELNIVSKKVESMMKKEVKKVSKKMTKKVSKKVAKKATKKVSTKR